MLPDAYKRFLNFWKGLLTLLWLSFQKQVSNLSKRMVPTFDLYNGIVYYYYALLDIRSKTRLWHRIFNIENYKASLPVTCVVLRPEANSAQSRVKTSWNGNLVVISVRKIIKKFERSYKKLIKTRIQYENSLYRSKEICILQRSFFGSSWSLSCIVLPSDHTLFSAYLLKQSSTYYSVCENC